MNAEMPKSAAPQDGPMAGRKSVFSHMGICCFDLKKMEDFYTRVIGMQVTDRGLAGPDRVVGTLKADLTASANRLGSAIAAQT